MSFSRFPQRLSCAALALCLLSISPTLYAKETAQVSAISTHALTATIEPPSAIAYAIDQALWQSAAQTTQTPHIWSQLNNQKNRDSTDYWINALQASGGSAAGNATLFTLFVALDVVPSLWGGTSFIDPAGFFLAFLALIPAVSTPLFMHWFSPSADADHWIWSGTASLIATSLHLALMIGLGFAFNQAGFSQGLAPTFYLLAPAGFLSALLVESLLTSAGHSAAVQQQRLQATDLTHPAAGVTLAHFSF